MLRAPVIVEWVALVLASSAASVSAQDRQEPVRGLVRALDEALISTELNARILEITHREGESFKVGEVLVRFDCRKYETELAAARAEEEFNRITLANSIALDKRKAIGRLEVEQNRTRYDKAKAQAETLANQVDECTISAPFDGRVGEVRAKAYEMSRPNEPLMRLVNTDRLEIELIVPSLWLRWLKPGTNFRVVVDETETVHDATVKRIAATVDSVSQTVKIMAVFAEVSKDILPGMSLTAELKQPGP
jgi:membrane fusion protein (multidrug efflux system)